MFCNQFNTMNKLTLGIIMLIWASLASSFARADVSKLNASFALLYLDGSGNPDENYLGFAETKDYESLVPRFSVSWDLTEQVQVAASWTDFGTLVTEWEAPQGPPFEGFGMAVVTPFTVVEDMRSLGVGVAYVSDWRAGSLRLGLGAEHVTNHHHGWFDKKEEDWSLALSVGYEYPLTESLSLSVDYLQIEPPNKTLRLVGGAIAWKF